LTFWESDDAVANSRYSDFTEVQNSARKIRNPAQARPAATVVPLSGTRDARAAIAR
jgi:hypothetical protein